MRLDYDRPQCMPRADETLGGLDRKFPDSCDNQGFQESQGFSWSAMIWPRSCATNRDEPRRTRIRLTSRPKTIAPQKRRRRLRVSSFRSSQPPTRRRLFPTIAFTSVWPTTPSCTRLVGSRCATASHACASRSGTKRRVDLSVSTLSLVLPWGQRELKRDRRNMLIRHGEVGDTR